MRYRSAVSPAMAALFALFVLLLLAGGALALTRLTGPARVVLPVLDGLLAALLVWAFFTTRYTLAPDALVLQCGPLTERLPYGEIRTAVRTRGYGFLMCLAFDRLELNPGEDPARGKIVLSPEREDEFLEELARRCPDLQIR